MGNDDLVLMEVSLDKSDLELIGKALAGRIEHLSLSGQRVKAERCAWLSIVFTGAHEAGLSGILFSESNACTWALDTTTDARHGDCGIIWMFGEGTPTENEVSFCPQCGRRLEERS